MAIFISDYLDRDDLNRASHWRSPDAESSRRDRTAPVWSGARAMRVIGAAALLGALFYVSIILALR